MSKLVKRAPSQNWEGRYDVSDGLIESISKDTHEGWNEANPKRTPIQVALILAAGKTLVLTNPFGTRVEWTMEDEAHD